MITGELKNRIDGLWEVFWTGGLTNPLDVIEQMTYLMFVHDLDEADKLFPAAKQYAMVQEPPFTDRGSVAEVFANAAVWARLRAAIARVNANAGVA